MGLGFVFIFFGHISVVSVKFQEQEKEKEQEQEQEQEQDEDQDEESIISLLLSDTEPKGKKHRAPKRVLAFVRVKPTAHFAQDMIRLGSDNKSIEIYIQKSPRGGAVNNSQTDWSFKLDGLLHNTSQEMVYETVAKGLVSRALQGYNGTIMCYGQTGAGKTYTMTGTTSEYRNRGIIPRAIQQIFKSAAEFLNIMVTVRISYLEIYNEALFDLLAPALGRGCKENQLSVIDGPQGVYVKGLSIHPVSHEEEALHLLFEGETNRVISEHSLNKNSSRSHCIFTIYIESDGQVRVEASYINKSLSFLEQLVIALADPKREHIPFRQSKLTHVLKDSLGGKCNTVLVTNIYGEAEHVEETLSSLRFATRMNWVTAEPVPNGPFYQEASVKVLEEEIQLLKQELIMQNSLTDNSLMSYNPLTTAQRAEIKSQVQKYLRGVIEEIDIVNVRQIQEVFRQFKVILNQQEEEVESRLWSKYGLRYMIESGSSSSFDLCLEKEQEDMEGTTDKDEDLEQEDDAGTLEIESPPTSPIPRGKREAKKDDEKESSRSPPPETSQDESSQSKTPTTDLEEEEEGGDQDSDEEPTIPSSEDFQNLRPPVSKQEAFELFKKVTGQEIHRIFRDNKRILIAKKKRSHAVAQEINSLKQQMEAIKEALEAQKQKRRQEGQYMDEKGQVIIDEEEFSLILKLKGLKEEHRAGFTELQDLKAEIQYCQQLLDKCRKRLISGTEHEGSAASSSAGINPAWSTPKHHGIPEWFGLEGTLKLIQFQSPPTVPGCSQPCPAWPWALPGIQGQPQLLWAPVPRPAHPPSQEFLPQIPSSPALWQWKPFPLSCPSSPLPNYHSLLSCVLLPSRMDFIHNQVGFSDLTLNCCRSSLPDSVPLLLDPTPTWGKKSPTRNLTLLTSDLLLDFIE
uniref:Kinesin motor domain-containing protein n=1 Tax=Taeniopygia guttata TaxID=59729 RepID=A0A674HRL8_TAEGU